MPEKSTVEKIMEKRFSYKSKAIASVAVCVLGAASMYITKGETGVGWAIFGMWLIWS